MPHDPKLPHPPPNYPAMARHLALLSVEAAALGERLGEARYLALAERLRECAEQIEPKANFHSL